MKNSSSLSARLRVLDTPVLSDALDTLGIHAVADVQPLGPAVRIAGPARTVLIGHPADDGVRPRHLGTAAIEEADAGDVIVIAHRSRDDAAGWGGLLSLAAQLRGVEGVLIDGLARDLDDFHALGFPVYGRAGVPTSARGRVVELAADIPVPIGTGTCHPGDWVVADRSGAVVIPRDRVNEVLARAEWLMSRETAMADRLRAGEVVTQVLDRSYEEMLHQNSAH
ncbi:RraA family protein [Nocardioides sp.]|uniref:RraA family protein n=1 Tax=Nocardioides sp. TaxID=35761 RepID=UPI003D0B4574